jgi:hypothetical protein
MTDVPRVGMWFAVAFVLAGCSDDPAALEPPLRYTIEVSGEEFVVEVTSQAQVDDMEARLASGVESVINGEIASGDGGYNQPWSWHLVPATVETPDLAVEVCDGRPSMVEEDLEYWLGTVGRFCPWGAVVIARGEPSS